MIFKLLFNFLMIPKNSYYIFLKGMLAISSIYIYIYIYIYIILIIFNL